MTALIAAREASRLEALAGHDIRFGEADPRIDLITRLASTICNAPVAFVAFVDDDTVRLKSAVGIKVRCMARANDFCSQTIATPTQLTVVPDARHDVRYSHHPWVAGAPHLRAYAGVPLVDSHGYAMGALSVMDFLPRGFSDEQLQMLNVLGKEVAALLDLCDTVHRLQGELSEHLRYERRLEEAQRELRQSAGLLQLAATTDSLTLIANRNAFNLRLLDEIERVTRSACPLSLLAVDIDHFKRYNDDYGHPAGDQALCTVAQLLQRTVRKVDLVARIGGDEFAVILPFTNLAGAKIAAEKCRVAIEQHHWVNQPLRISIGAAQYERLSVDGSELISAADSALYGAKFDGRNKVVALHGAGNDTTVTPLAVTPASLIRSRA